MKLVNAGRIIKEVEERFDGVVTVNELVAICNDAELVDAEIVSRCRNCEHLSCSISQLDGCPHYTCTLYDVVTQPNNYCCPDIRSQLEGHDAKS